MHVYFFQWVWNKKCLMSAILATFYRYLTVWKIKNGNTNNKLIIILNSLEIDIELVKQASKMKKKPRIFTLFYTVKWLCKLNAIIGE